MSVLNPSCSWLLFMTTMRKNCAPTAYALFVQRTMMRSAHVFVTRALFSQSFIHCVIDSRLHWCGIRLGGPSCTSRLPGYIFYITVINITFYLIIVQLQHFIFFFLYIYIFIFHITTNLIFIWITQKNDILLQFSKQHCFQCFSTTVGRPYIKTCEHCSQAPAHARNLYQL